MWFTKEVEVVEEPKSVVTQLPEFIDPPDVPIIEKQVTIKTITKFIPLFVYNACSVLDVFTVKPIINIKVNKTMLKESDGSNHTIAVIGIMVFLVALAINAIMDVLKVKEEEKERRKLNPSGERRQSLAEFANKKHLRRQSSKFGLQLFQIAESTPNNDEENTNRRQSRPYTRGDSTNSYLSDRKTQPDSPTPTESTEPRLVKRQSVAKLFGMFLSI